MVQFVNVRKLKNQLSEAIRWTRKGDVVVTRRGKPQAVLHRVSEENLEDYLLAHSAKFQKSLEASYRQYQRKGGMALDSLIVQAERELARLRR
ncbi:MAG: type II toxin-antitoxin system prevent-host-death family antitoxin [Candidatus Omnitrophica bacterium]|nr:type II toxin-antitoxin system prevent-host-death family antitoxin [Candidatus Omnitrophota bacterium]